MINYVNGDLLKSDCTVIGHQANCFSTMGAGIAKRIKELYPEAYEADKKAPYKPRQKLGKVSFAFSKEKRVFIMNLYGQFRYGRDKDVVYTNYDALENAIELMMQMADRLKMSDFPVKVGLPNGMGCNNANGDWGIVSKRIERVSEKHQTDIYIYNYAP